MSFTYRVLLKPIDICFNKKLLPSSFDDGIPVRETLQQLANGEILLEDLPIIDVVWCQKKWVWYTLNNRRLWVFRELEKLGKCQYIATRRVESFERVTNYIVYGSAELIGESTIVEWDEDDGQKSASSDGSGSKATTDKRNWREVTPLMVTVRWNDLDKGDADDKSMVTPDPDEHSLGKQQVEQDDGNPDETDESQRERNDSGYYPSSSGRTSPRDLSDNETEYETVFSETESSEESKSSGRRFNRFESDRPQVATYTPSAKLPSRNHVRSYSVPPSRKRVFKTSTRQTKPSRRPRTVYSLIASESLRALMFRRRDIP